MSKGSDYDIDKDQSKPFQSEALKKMKANTFDLRFWPSSLIEELYLTDNDPKVKEHCIQVLEARKYVKEELDKKPICIEGYAMGLLSTGTVVMSEYRGNEYVTVTKEEIDRDKVIALVNKFFDGNTI